jgi:hypothetical protein
MSYHDDGSDWISLDDLLSELGMSRDELLRAYPHVDLSHRGLNDEVVIDRRQLEA